MKLAILLFGYILLALLFSYREIISLIFHEFTLVPTINAYLIVLSA